MPTTSEMKKLIGQIGVSLNGLSKQLADAKGQFESARAQAQTVVQGSASDIEQTLVARLKQASESAETAVNAVSKAAEACNNYATQTL